MSRGDSGTNADVPTPYAGNGALSIDDDVIENTVRQIFLGKKN
jgi:hypothetical protein